MKKIPYILITIATVILAIIIFFTIVHDKYYPMTAIVIETSETNDRVTIKDYNGNLWQFEGIEDYEVGDMVTCIMNNKLTDHIKDDKIVKVKYSGTIEGWSK